MELVARSCIKPSLLRATLFRGTGLAACGVCLIIGSGTLLPYFLLHLFGLPLLLLGFILIGLGLVPYRRLSKLEVTPYELNYESNFLVLAQSGHPLVKVPLEHVENVDYLEKERLYGIGLRLKVPMRGKVIVCREKVDISPFVSPFTNYDLFLPYFTRSGYEELEDFLD